MKQFLLFLTWGFFILGANAQTVTVNTFVTASDDDAEESQDGTDISQSSSDLEMVFDDGDQTVGIRFLEVEVPPNATIESAYIQFTAEEDGNTPTNLIIKGNKVAFSTTFIDATNNISGRPMTTAEVSWDNVPAWIDNDAGLSQQTPDLSEIVTEIISSNNWQQGNPLTFIISGTGERTAFSYDGNISFAPELIITYTPNNENDLSIGKVHQPEALMYPNSATSISIEILNLGLSSQTDFEVSYSINGGNPVTEMVSETINTGEGINYIFAQSADLSLVGNYQIEFEVTLPNDEISGNNVLIQNVSVLSEVGDLFFDSGSNWKYLDDGSNQGTTWQELNFDDSDWSVGQGHFGFGDNDENTFLNAGSITYYFRKKINILDINLLQNIYLNLVHDDAAVVHINGNEILRSDLLPAGTIGHLTEATDVRPTDIENVFVQYQLNQSAFQNGDNIIAIEIHNVEPDNVDLSFDCNIADTVIYQLDGPYVFYRNGEIVVKSIESSGYQSYTYQDPANAILTCRFPDGSDSFTVELKPQLEIKPSIYDLPQKFLATSDLEGNLEAFVFLLKDAGVMDENFNWIFGAGHLMILGDMFDRGSNVTECLWLLYRLENQAIMQGGQINFIIGNHDISNLTSDFDDTHPKYGTNAVLMDEILETLYANDSELGRWLRTKNIIERTGPFIFVHGGLSSEMTALNLTYDEINDWGRVLMDDNCQSVICETIDGSSGIYWYRGLANELVSQQEVDDALDAFGGDKVLIGHTVFDEITLLYNNKVIAIDLHHAANFVNGFMEAFYYESGELFEFFTNGNLQTYTLLDVISNNDNVETVMPQITIMPNPSNGEYYLRVNGVDDWLNISVVNAQGKIVMKKNKVSVQENYSEKIDLSGLPKGIYFLQLATEQNRWSRKLVKK